MKLLVIGPGCARCKTLAQFTEQAVNELGISAEISKITGLKEIIALGVIMTPALAVNGQVKVVGKVPSIAEIKVILQQAAAENVNQPGIKQKSDMSSIKFTDPDALRETVRAGYSKIAASGSERRQSSCCGGMSPLDADKLARHVGYSAEELAALPGGANIGLSCGNPNALASLRAGEVLLDLGSGAGFDAFVAGPKVGSSGHVIGVDMTPEMLARARKNIAPYRSRTGLDNVEFRLGEIEHLPLADESVDVIISNCVINLSPDKPQVWREMARVLKPGGRVAVSDLALLRPLPEAVRSMVEALVGCVAGAVLVSDTERMAHSAGLSDIRLNPKPGYVEALMDGHDPLYLQIMAHLPPGTKPADYITSLEITARKPSPERELQGGCCETAARS